MLLHDHSKTAHPGIGSLFAIAWEELKSERKNLLLAFSLANLCFINVWYLDEQIPSAAFNYFRKAPADGTLLEATFFAVVILALFFWVIWRAVAVTGSRTLARFVRAGFLLILSYPVEKLIVYLSPPPDQFSYVASIVSIAAETTLLLGIMLTLVFSNYSVFKVAKAVTAVLVLLVPSMAIDLLWAWLPNRSAAAFADRPLAPLANPHKPAASRVLWLIFDEFDHGLAFDYRPPDLKMPNLDRIRGESFYADHTEATARWTVLAIPALFSGHILAKAELKDIADLRVWPDGAEKPISWREQRTIFSRMRAAGMNSGLLGWHHPYCRIFNDSVSRCYWVPSDQGTDEITTEFHTRHIGLARSILFLFRWKSEDILSALRIPFYPVVGTEVQQSVREGQLTRYQNVRTHALEAALDPNLDLVLVHWPTPHPYSIYNRRAGDFATQGSGGYLDNLALVDRTVGEFRQKLEQAGLWDSTSILITSDHPFRTELWKQKYDWGAEMDAAVRNNRTAFVPFFVKLARDTTPAEYHGNFNAVLTNELVWRILQGNFRTNADIGAWLDANHTRTSSD